MVIDTGRNAVEFSQGQRFDSFCFDLPQKIIRKNFPKTIDKSAQVCYNNYSKRKEIKKMFVWKTWRKEKRFAGVVKEAKEYRVLLLLGFIPLFIWING